MNPENAERDPDPATAADPHGSQTPGSAGRRPEPARPTAGPETGRGGTDSAPAGESAPDSPAELLPFARDDYPTTVAESGLTKLIDSQVAPLVAAARGYETVTLDDLPALEARASGIDTPEGVKRIRSGQLRQALALDALVMPWFAANRVHQVGEALTGESLLQVRPAESIRTGAVDSLGRPEVKKYDNLAGAGTVVDLHPAVPPEWVTDTDVPVIFTEGILKADSALTALLLESEYSPDELEAIEEADPATALASNRRMLRRYLRDLNPTARHLVLAAVGVSTWRGDAAAWSHVALKRRRFFLAFDGDMHRNRAVWNQASKLWQHAERKGADVTLVDLSGPEGMTGQLGLDDFFGVGGRRSFSQVIDNRTAALPPHPGDDDMEPGRWRIAPDGLTTEECVEAKDDSGNTTLAWVTRLRYGARVRHVSSQTSPTEEALRSGVYDPEMAAPADQSRVEVEFRWHSPDSDQVATAVVRGNGGILSQMPYDWPQRSKASIPHKLALHPQWPPHHGAGSSFFQAFKAHRSSEIEESFAWDAMGWLPGSTALVFVVGNQVIPVDPNEDTIRPGVSDAQVASASRFGLPDGYVDPSDPDAEEKVEELLHHVAGLFTGAVPGLPAEQQPFRRTDYGAVLFLAGIRPVIPAPPTAPLYLHGPPQKGKSFAAGCAMAFWQAHPGAFGEGNLPGNASDTFASTEHAVSRVPMWLLDDVSPKQSVRAAEQQATRVEDLIRSVYNGQAKGRMQIKDGDLTARQRSHPRALFMVTGEMAPETPSIRQRTLLLHMDGTTFGDGKEVLAPLRDMRDRTNAAAHLNRLLLDAVIWRIRRHPRGWPGIRQKVEESRLLLQRSFAHQMDVEDATRPAANAADLALGVLALEALSDQWFTTNERRHKVFDLVNHLQQQVAKVAMESYLDQKLASNGTRLMDGVQSVLMRGEAYIADPSAPSSPPLHRPGQEMSNRQLGWNGSEPPRAPMIGTLYTKDRDEDDALVLLNAKEAFSVVAARCPDLVARATSASAAWLSVWSNEIATADRWTRPRTTSGALQHFVRVALPNGSRVAVVPVSLRKILGQEPLIPDDVVETMVARAAEEADRGDDHLGLM